MGYFSCRFRCCSGCSSRLNFLGVFVRLWRRMSLCMGRVVELVDMEGIEDRMVWCWFVDGVLCNLVLKVM